MSQDIVSLFFLQVFAKLIASLRDGRREKHTLRVWESIIVLDHTKLGPSTQAMKQICLRGLDSNRAMTISVINPEYHLKATSNQLLLCAQSKVVDVEVRPLYPEFLDRVSVGSKCRGKGIGTEDQDAVARQTIWAKFDAVGEVEVEADVDLVICIAVDVGLGDSVNQWHSS